VQLKRRYELLFERVSSPKSLDVGRSTIYSFERYCKNCNKGLIRPERHHKKEARGLFSKSYCSIKCKQKGKRKESTFPLKIKEEYATSKVSIENIEEMAFCSLLSTSYDNQKNQISRFVRIANKQFQLLSEKLSYLERKTGQRWYCSKFYYWLKKS